ncbi:response regulator receiver modulated diguanylate cyclase [Desulfovibrio sp. X2]|uniref:GGDEF domain-containing response regulator n=1 Tax=Desulfovibrio sp. X2 TaxID=941449 RepID=UPI000358A93D|nr:diguanylate cyclase [Desulfovibrio sp. X2]EPR39868.1 response regulator receiver modulated diguanylate cyclase [Desulfovibrio sp. X2]
MDEKSASASGDRAKNRTPSPQGEALRALVVEDDAIIREDMVQCLRRAGVMVIPAGDGKEALGLFLEHFPDLVVTDIRMPHMDGLELVRRIRELSDEVCVVLISAFTDNETLLASINLGVNGFMPKPVARQELIDLSQRCSLAGKGERTLLRKVLDNNPDLFLTTDGERILYVNRPFLDFLGIQSISGMDAMALVASRISPAEGYEGDNWIAALASDDSAADHLMALAPPVGGEGERAFLVRVSRLPVEDTLFSIISFIDVTSIQEERDFYLDLALKDPLTGLGNRKRLMDELEKEIWRAERYAKDLSLIMFDIDDFKRVNDTWGHQEGDHVLREMARIVREDMRRVDLVTRYGGEEFCCLLPETDLRSACCLAEKLRRIVATHDYGKPGRLTASFGVAQHFPGESSDDLIARADQALYAAKRSGKDRVEPAPDPSDLEELSAAGSMPPPLLPVADADEDDAADLDPSRRGN